MDKVTVIAIARNFATTKKGWLRDNHFRNKPTLPDDVKQCWEDCRDPLKNKNE